jgi:hypothetical protein
MRGFKVVVPGDCVASEREPDHDHALHQMARLLKAEIVASDNLNFERIQHRTDEGSGTFASRI